MRTQFFSMTFRPSECEIASRLWPLLQFRGTLPFRVGAGNAGLPPKVVAQIHEFEHGRRDSVNLSFRLLKDPGHRDLHVVNL